MNKSMIKRVGNILLNVLLCIFLIISILSVLVTVLAKRDADGAAELFGYQMRVVTSDSMGECELTDVSGFEIKSIPVGSMVFVEVMPSDPAEADEWYRSLKVGDVLTFRYVYTTQITITHRITSIEEKKTGGFVIELAGDNKNSEDGQLVQLIDTSVPNNTNYVIGKVTAHTYVFGLFMTFLTHPVGMVAVIILPCLVIIGLEVSKIVRVLGAEKREKEAAEKELKEKELEELRRRIAELERVKAEDGASPEDGGEK